MRRIGLTGLVKIELPAATIRLCDGGFLVWGAETFSARDAVFGVISSIEPMSEGVEAEVPALEMTMIPASTAAAADLSQPGFQRSRVRLWIAEFDVDAGTLIGTPAMKFDGQIDQTSLSFGREQRELAMTVVSNAERLFERNIGNSLSASFQQSVWPGDTGQDNATGLGRPVAWGTESPMGFGGGGGSGPPGGRGEFARSFWGEV